MTNGDFASLDEIMDIESHTVDAMMQSMHLRKATPALLEGSFGELYARGSVYMFERVLGDERYVAAMNFSGREAKLPVASGTSVAISNYPEDTQADAPLRPWEFRLIAP